MAVLSSTQTASVQSAGGGVDLMLTSMSASSKTPLVSTALLSSGPPPHGQDKKTTTSVPPSLSLADPTVAPRLLPGVAHRYRFSVDLRSIHNTTLDSKIRSYLRSVHTYGVHDAGVDKSLSMLSIELLCSFVYMF